MASPTQEITELRRRIEEANHAYYLLDAPVMPDAEFDLLFRRLQALEAAHPDLLVPDSPTQRVGARAASSLTKHVHLRPMVSLANAFDPDELAAWEARNARLNEAVTTAGYTTEVKIDGAAVSLTYRNGHLETGATRGNGTVGEVITENLKTVADIPVTLRGTGHPALLEVRGEVYLTHTAFNARSTGNGTRRGNHASPTRGTRRRAVSGSSTREPPGADGCGCSPSISR